MARHEAGSPSQGVIDVDITALNGDGDGVAVYGRGHVAVPYTLPGERVRITLPRTSPGARRPQSARRSSASVRAEAGGPDTPRARLVAILRPSPHRVEPACPHFGPGQDAGCGGCAWQHIAYPEQLRLKTARVDTVVRAAFREAQEILRDAPATLPMLPTTPLEAPWAYRHKVHFVFGQAAGRRGPLTMGHYARGSRRIVPVETCPVHAEAGNDVAFALHASLARAGVGAAGVAAADSRARGARDEGTLKSVAVRVAHGTA
jgi:23S rRNA (uracil1939-C5)-methyltransferase